MDRARGRALLIDDDDAERQLLADLLSVLGYHTTTASDGTEGLARFQAGQYDLVVTDLRMPGLNGWDVAAGIRGQNAGVPVIIATGFVADIDTERAHALRAVVLTKPFGFDELRTACHQAAALTVPGRLRERAEPPPATPDSPGPLSGPARDRDQYAGPAAVQMDEARALAVALAGLARRAEALAVQHERLQFRLRSLEHLEEEVRRLTATVDRVNRELADLQESYRLLRQERDSVGQRAAQERSQVAAQLQALLGRLTGP